MTAAREAAGTTGEACARCVVDDLTCALFVRTSECPGAPTLAEAGDEVPAKFRALVPGRRYRVRFEDCCVNGHFDAVFRAVALTRDVDGTPFCDGLRFNTALIGPDWGAFAAFEIGEVE